MYLSTQKERLKALRKYAKDNGLTFSVAPVYFNNKHGYAFYERFGVTLLSDYHTIDGWYERFIYDDLSNYINN